MNPLNRLAALGTSVWIDGLVPPAELERLVRQDSVTGQTSNPTIFRAAVLGTEGYAPRVAAHDGAPPQTLYEALAVEDVQAAAEVLAPVYARTGGADGFVSLEVAPELAHDADATVAAARRLWARVDRPNAMIKIPATPAGVDAIRRSIADGININVTLLFGLDAHTAVMQAYVAGLAERAARREPVRHVASVASFFVSRVDTAVDELLNALGRLDLTGRAAVANARLAYANARHVFSGDRFAALARAGAVPQRVLWASTGTKNPAYGDAKYVEELAGPGVVNTMPSATLAAFRDHGHVEDTLTGTAPAALDVLAALAAAGVDLDAVTAQLLDAGVDAFDASMHDLLAGLAPRHACV
jgi:transaldolase